MTGTDLFDSSLKHQVGEKRSRPDQRTNPGRAHPPESKWGKVPVPQLSRLTVRKLALVQLSWYLDLSKCFLDGGFVSTDGTDDLAGVGPCGTHRKDTSCRLGAAGQVPAHRLCDGSRRHQ